MGSEGIGGTGQGEEIVVCMMIYLIYCELFEGICVFILTNKQNPKTIMCLKPETERPENSEKETSKSHSS